MSGNGDNKKRRISKAAVTDIIIAVLIALAISVFVRPVTVLETSMQPSIQPHDHLLMAGQAYRFGEVRRGDIIIFRSDIPEDTGSGSKLLIKRVIGVPGDIITISEGRVYMNGSEVREDYISGGGTPGEIYNLKVPKEEVFVMGDHRKVSLDSREFGCVEQSRIKGRAVLRFWPLDETGFI